MPLRQPSIAASSSAWMFQSGASAFFAIRTAATCGARPDGILIPISLARALSRLCRHATHSPIQTDLLDSVRRPGGRCRPVSVSAASAAVTLRATVTVASRSTTPVRMPAQYRRPLNGQAEAAVDDEHLAAHHVGVGRAEKRDRAGDVVGRDEAPDRIRGADSQHLIAVREMLERAGLDDAVRDGVDTDSRRELDGEVAHERLERGLRR